MQRSARLIPWLCCLTFCLPTQAGLMLDADPPRLEVPRSSWDEVALRLEVPELEARPAETVAGAFTRLSLTEESLTGELGAPALPVVRRLIEIPWGAEVELVA